MPSKTIQYTTRDGVRCDGYLSKPDGDGPFPGILLITAIFGVDDDVKAITDRLAAFRRHWQDAGVLCVLPEHVRGNG